MHEKFVGCKHVGELPVMLYSAKAEDRIPPRNGLSRINNPYDQIEAKSVEVRPIELEELELGGRANQVFQAERFRFPGEYGTF